MSKALAKLLGVPDYKMAKIVEKLESISGYQSEDIKLLVENRRLISRIVRRHASAMYR
jgi:hypothetical protein